ncbi:arginine--tRNA ligase [Christensenella intestinihominis]|uniref:arginine--tRNA ligase n=1 Tax=Christensenella intestinihominis TaxID=1851429 RepID=UPI000836E022|nr:arginine--tRNA ligase [Christensenella intestinihominis]
MDLKTALAETIAKAAELPAGQVAEMIETPPDPKMGDAALPCFKLAKELRKVPPVIAQELAEKIEAPDFVERVEVAGGYLNFFYDRKFYAESVLDALGAAGENWGRSEIGAGKTVVIDYSSVNIAKPFHIGHLSSTAIGSALYKIYKYLGYNVVGVNHLGDWGTQFGKLIAAYKMWGNDDEINRDSVSAMLKLYVRFHEEAEKDESLNEQGRAWFKKIEDGDEEALRIFGWFKELTLREAKRVYALLDVQFDSFAGESFYNDKIPAVLDELRGKKLLEQSEGAWVVRLDEEGLPPAIILKSDGTTLYATRDLAAAEYRKKTYDFYKNLYVVAYQQNLHFKQLFAVLKKMGHEWASGCEHVAFGMVSLEDGTMSTRKGKIVLLEDVLKKAVEKTLAVIEEKNPGLADKEQVASDIGIGAVIFSTLSQSRIKDITFSFDRVLNYDGETGPYVQYTHTRCASVLARHQDTGADADLSVLENDDAFAVLKLLAAFPQTIVAASEKNEPFYVTRYLLDLAQAFNKYYYEYRIIDDNAAQTNARVALTRAVKDTLKTGLKLLGIKAPNKM